MTERLIGAKRQSALHELHGWSEVEDRDAIRKTYHFADFVEAWGFMSRAALIAERMNHYPEWLNLDNRVEVVLTTHELEGISDLDVKLAQQLDQIAPQHDR